MATTEWQPSFKKCFHTTVCVSSFVFVVQLFAHFLRVYYLYAHREHTNIQEKDGKRKTGREKKL